MTDDLAGAVYAFGHDHGVPRRGLGGLLGGKGAGLAEMTSTLGLPVPPGFTIAVPMCRAYRQSGWPAELDELLPGHMRALEQKMGRCFGDAADPLLVAVRSGAPKSMPGMLDSVLNIGLNEAAVEGLAAASGDEGFAWDSYRRFVTMYATIVLDIAHDVLAAAGSPAEGAAVDAVKAQVKKLLAAVEAAGHRIPDTPGEQLRGAVEAVFRSWDSPRAKAYRQHEAISEDMGTAVNVQAMVFGNRSGQSGTGVVFTRDPATGHPEPYGDYLWHAQGEDVVSGKAQTQKIAQMAIDMPAVYEELRRHLARLEGHYRDICDVEFTIEQGKLWILQTRIGKRGAIAAVRAAVQMVSGPAIGLTPAEAVSRVPAEIRARARAETLSEARGRTAGTGGTALIATGLAASPGRASGTVVLSADAAADSTGDVILVRSETSTEDVHGMSVAAGLLTSTGGLVSHAAVVARGWDIPAVVGAGDLVIGDEHVATREGKTLFSAGDTITIDGGTGQVWLGQVEDLGGAAGGPADEELLEIELPELRILESWAAEHEDA